MPSPLEVQKFGPEAAWAAYSTHNGLQIPQAGSMASAEAMLVDHQSWKRVDLIHHLFPEAHLQDLIGHWCIHPLHQNQSLSHHRTVPCYV